MDQAREAARSSFETTKVGCAVIGPAGDLLATGYNHVPWGVRQGPDRESKPEKHKFLEHAERAALYSCLREGVSTMGARMFCTLFCCADCARGIAMAGITELTAPEPDWDDPVWGGSWTAARQILDEIGVKVHWHRPPCVAQGHDRRTTIARGR